jgi:hypothetical protein
VIPQKSSLHEALKNSRGQGDKFYPMVSFMNPGHNESRKNLKSIVLEDMNGEKIFDSFVKRVTR